ncbi:MAG: hypothetical protein O3A01_03970 [bacterium]|nr:hypothetical protein [bacterium]
MVDGLGFNNIGSSTTGTNSNTPNPLGSGFTDLIAGMQADMAQGASEVPADGKHVSEQLTEFSMLMFKTTGNSTGNDPMMTDILAKIGELIDMLLELLGVEKDKFYEENNLEEFEENAPTDQDAQMTQFSFIAIQMIQVSKTASTDVNEEASEIIEQMTGIMANFINGGQSTGLGNQAGQGVRELMKDPSGYIERMRLGMMNAFTGDSESNDGSFFGGGSLFGGGFDPNLGMLDEDGDLQDPNTQIF